MFSGRRRIFFYLFTYDDDAAQLSARPFDHLPVPMLQEERRDKQHGDDPGAAKDGEADTDRVVPLHVGGRDAHACRVVEVIRPREQVTLEAASRVVVQTFVAATSATVPATLEFTL